MPVLHGSMLENSVNQIHGNCNLRENIQHKLADLSMYCVKRIYAIQAASSERKCTWGFKMNVFMAVLLFFDSTVTLPQQIHLNTSLVTATDWSINWLSWVLCPTGHKISHFGDVLISQSQYSAEINKWVWAHYSTGDCELNRLLILATLSIGLHLRGYVSFKAHTTVLTTKFLWCQSSCVERLAIISQRTHTHTHTHTFNSPLSGTTHISGYQKGKTNLDFTEDSEWQWHQLGHMQVYTLLQTDNHASTPPLSFLQAGCPSFLPTNSVKALKALISQEDLNYKSPQGHMFRLCSTMTHWDCLCVPLCLRSSLTHLFIKTPHLKNLCRTIFEVELVKCKSLDQVATCFTLKARHLWVG